ncbi:uncharacterized protein TNCV_577571 [Trichonephila clavipes]|nr:uncharacterized protein TNCV_577571 [Trichonephila clavipes]
MMDDPICYELTSVRCYSPKSFPAFKASLDLSFSRIMYACMLLYAFMTVRNYCSAQHMQLLLWPAYWPEMLLIEHVWNGVGRRLARGPYSCIFKRRSASSFCLYALYGIIFHKQTFKYV